MLSKRTTVAGLCAFCIAVLWLSAKRDVNLHDAVFLTRNSIRERIWQRRVVYPEFGDTAFDGDFGLPMGELVGSVFPIDLVVSYNASVLGANETWAFLGRYASFSPILGGTLRANYRIFPTLACDPIDKHQFAEFHNKALVVSRGGCKFIDKMSNILGSGLDPLVLFIANNEPKRGLITMYTNIYQDDSAVPIVFISYEAREALAKVELQRPVLLIQTGPFDSWLNLLVLLTISPPLMFIIAFLLVQYFTMVRRKHLSVLTERVVRRLPVHIYAGNHLVPAKHFFEYLTATGQTDQLQLLLCEDLADERAWPEESSLYVVNGTDLYSLDVALLYAHKDYFATHKCSICLDRFRPLHLRVLVLECRHVYHEKCLLNWLIHFKRTCPLCNASLHLEGLALLDEESAVYGLVDDGLVDDGLERSMHNDFTRLSETSSQLARAEPTSLQSNPTFYSSRSQILPDIASSTDSALFVTPFASVPENEEQDSRTLEWLQSTIEL